MSEQVLTNQPVITLDVVKATFNLELTQNKFQEIQNAVNMLLYNEENIPAIKEVLEKVKKLKKVVDDAHESGKKPYLEAGRLYDTAKKDFYTLIDAILTPAADKYTKLCREKQIREENEAKEAARKKAIQDGIQGNILAFSQRIAAANTSAELLQVERLINLEKANKVKYAEFLEEASEKYSTFLNTPLKDQKEKIRQLEEIEAQKKVAMEKDDDIAVLDLHYKEEALQAQIEENKQTTQEAAIAEVTKPVVSDYSVVSSPAVKPSRKSWKFEVKDIQSTFKKMPSWVNMEPNEAVIKAYLDGKKAEGIAEGTKEFEVAGIRFYLEEKFI